MKAAVVGAGIAGLTIAYDLVRAGHSVTVFEGAPQPGGLANGFCDPLWEWPLERFYHHLFETDTALRTLVDEIGFAQNLFFRKPVTAQWWHGKPYALDGVGPVLKFPGMPIPDRVRFGAAVAYLKYATSDWKALERTTAAAWCRANMGEAAYTTLIKPLLDGKFGPYADEVNMAWLWSRFKARSFQLGYFTGGFQALADALAAKTAKLGATIQYSTPVTAIATLEDGGWTLTPKDEPPREFDSVIVTGSPMLLSKLVPQLPESYLAQVLALKSLGAVVMTIALDRQLMTDGTYWLNAPKGEFPFLALVEHTNFVPAAHYGGDHLIYCGDYLPADHEHFRLSKEELLVRFLPALAKVNPSFDASWVRDSWLHREQYAQPIAPVGHSANIPPIETPLPGLFWASMSQVYPWDRGTNFAVEIGRRAAQEMIVYGARVNLQGGGVLARVSEMGVMRSTLDATPEASPMSDALPAAAGGDATPREL